MNRRHLHPITGEELNAPAHWQRIDAAAPSTRTTDQPKGTVTP